MKTKLSHRRSLLSLSLLASLAGLAACKTATDDAAGAEGQREPGDGATSEPGDGATSEPGGAPAKAGPTFAWARALDWQTSRLTTATAPNGDLIAVGVTETDAPIAVDALSFAPPTARTAFVARFAADGAPLYLRELAHVTPSGEYGGVFVQSIAADAQGGFAIMGSFNTEAMTLADGTEMTGATGFVLRCAADGSATWHDDVPGEGATALAFDAGGDLAVSSAEQHSFNESNRPGQLVLRRYGADGAMKWQRTIDDEYNDRPSSASVQFMPDGALYWVGVMKPGYLAKFAGPTADPTFLESGTPYVLFSAKYAPDGKPFFEDSYVLRSSDESAVARAALDEGGNLYVLIGADAATILLPGLSDAEDITFDGGIVKFDPQGVPQGLLPFSWGEDTFVSSFERAPGGRLVLAGTTAEPVTYLAAEGGKNVELVGKLGGRKDGFVIVIDAASGQAQGDHAYGDAFDQFFGSLSVNATGAFSLQGTIAGSMRLGGLDVGDASSPGERPFLAGGAL